MNHISYQFYIWLDAGWRHRYVIILPILIFPIIGFTVGSLSAKTYTAHTSMLIQETSKLNPFLEDFAVSAMLKERLSALQTLLHSRHILRQVAIDRKLINENTDKVEQERVINQLSSSLRMEMTGKDLIRIEYSNSDPNSIVPLLETVSNYFIEQLLAPERSSITDSSTFLADLLTNRQIELAAAENALATFKNQHAEQLPELHLGNVSRLAQLKQTLFEKEAELAGAIKTLGTIDQQLSKSNPVVANLEERIIQLQSRLALLKARYTDNHSQVQGAMRVLNRLQEERLEALQNQDNQIDVDQLWSMASKANNSKDSPQPLLLIAQLDHLQLARSKVDALTEETNSLKTMIRLQAERTSQLGELEKQLNELQRDLKVKRNLYEDLLERYELARVTGALGFFEKEKRIKVIDIPFTPSVPNNPSAILFLIAGILGGVVFGIGCAIFASINDHSIRYKKQVELKLGLEVLTRIPRVAPQDLRGGLLE
ncbi:MAG: chain-length determining protein [Alteromonadaceae bacterium]|nr:chain-length determining protein [Alteromonadaceae bacterium]